MIQLHLKIHQLFRFIQIGNIITDTWPNDPNEGKFTFILREIDWSFTFLNLLAILISFICSVYNYWDDVMTVMKALAQFVTGMDFLLNLIIFKLRKTHIQKLLKEIEDFLRTSNNDDEIILQKYTHRYSSFFVLVAICHCLDSFGFCCGPIFLSTKWPIEVWQINLCIKKHQKIIKFVNEASHTVQYILYKTNIVMASAIIFGIFPFIRSIQVAMEIYNIPWFENSQYNIKDICFMIQRSQMPLGINIRDLLPTLSLEYFTKYFLTMISYYTAMRTIIGD
ncbi:uncharacterized protein [Polyergus mexicanus]|uniref:uncharacterized protein n=1 Tax=Polyergus mexicanus TaxID=615972 RepID=UPI0038B54AB6